MHFFIDHTKLPVQTGSNIKFGPSPSDQEGTFYLTTQFTLTESAKAFACQDGMMIVQRNDADPSNLVNLIIKPSKPTAVGVSAKYYIYKGIKFTSFFTGTSDSPSITPDSADKSKFIRKFWKDEAKRTLRLLPSSTSLNFGYGHNELPLSDPDNLNENRPIRDIFNGKAPAKPYPVEEGMWIGDFTSSTIGFEIELVTELALTSTLKSCRVPVIVFTTAGVTEELALRRRRELITTFIDPAAFFGMHAQIGVRTTTYTNNSQDPIVPKTLGQHDLYADIIFKFKNKNRIYFDIRSERGRPYNFYNNYKVGPGGANIVIDHDASDPNPNNTDLTTASALNTASEIYQTNGWPIIFFETINPHNATNNKVSFRLRIDGNTKPVLFVENLSLSNTDPALQKNFFKGSSMEDTAQDEWSKKVTLFFPNINAANLAGDPANSNVANYIKVYYFLGEPVTDNSGQNPRLLNKNYFDSAFCSIDMENLGDTAVKNGYAENPNPTYIKEALHDDGTGNFAFVAQSGAYWDNDRILFYARAHIKKRDIQNPRIHEGSGKKYLRTYIKRMSIANAEFANSLRNNFYYVCKQYFLNASGTSSLKILGLNSYHTFNRNAQNQSEQVLQEKEDLMLLGLTIDEIQAIKDTPPQSPGNPEGLSVSHPRYIFLERDHETNHLHDASTQHYRYYRYIIKIQGLRLNVFGVPVPAEVTPTKDSGPIKVYSRDNVFFSSAAFAESETFNATLNIDSNNNPANSDEIRNRIEFRIYRDGDIFINDNIDLSLVRKKVIPVNGLTEGAGATTTRLDTRPNYTLNNDDAIEGDISVAQKILYVFVNQNTDVLGIQLANTTVLCNLEIIMSDARWYVNPNTTPGYATEAAATTDSAFDNLINYTQQTFDFTPFNNNQVSAKKARKHNTNGDIIVKGDKNGVDVNRLYIKLTRKVFMVYVDRLTANAGTLIDTRMIWVETVRCFARPDLFAVFLGALRETYDAAMSANDVDVTVNYQCGGFAFPDGSSFPSQNHVNGDAFDNDYYLSPGPLGPGGVQANDERFIIALNKFGKGKYRYRIGPAKLALRTAVNNTLNPVNSQQDQNPAIDGGATHNSHLHTENKTIAII